MGLWDGIENAEIFERGNYLPPGFRGVVEVKRTLAKETRKSGLAFIVELRVVEVDSPGDEDHELSPVREGEKRTWFQKMTNKDVAFPAVAAWAAACAGYDPTDKNAVKEAVMPHLRATMKHATDNPEDNDFVGVKLRLSCVATITKEKQADFTRYDFSPYGEKDD